MCDLSKASKEVNQPFNNIEELSLSIETTKDETFAFKIIKSYLLFFNRILFKRPEVDDLRYSLNLINCG